MSEAAVLVSLIVKKAARSQARAAVYTRLLPLLVWRKKKDFVNYHRLNSIPCNIPNLNNPRDCYLGSNYLCRWSEHADRCNQVE